MTVVKKATGLQPFHSSHIPFPSITQSERLPDDSGETVPKRSYYLRALWGGGL